MPLLLVPIFLSALPGVRFSGREFQKTPLCRVQTDGLKGFFALLVLLSHSAYSYDILYLMETHANTFYFFDQQIAAPFFFFAGYALCEGIREKPAYRGNLPWRKIGAFLGAVTLLNVLSLLFAALIGEAPDGKTALLTLLCLAKPYTSRLGSIGWFAAILFLLYLLTWLSFTLFREKRRAAMLWLSLLCAGLFVLFRRFHLMDFWYNTILFYPAGFWLSEGREKLFSFLQKSNGRYLLLCGASLLLYVVFYRRYRSTSGLMAFEMMTVCLLFMLVLLSQKIRIGSRFLSFAGRNALGIYLFQSIPMKLLELGEARGVYALLPSFLREGTEKLHPWLYALLAAALTLLPFALLSLVRTRRNVHDTAQ